MTPPRTSSDGNGQKDRKKEKAPVTQARSLGEAIFLFRQRARITRDQLAEEVGVSDNTLTRLENDRTERIDAVTLYAVSRVLSERLDEEFSTIWTEVTRFLADIWSANDEEREV